LDCHLFADLQEGASKNVALTYHIKEKKEPKKNEPPDPNPDPDCDIKYSFATPKKVYNALQRTLKSGCPSKKRIQEDVFQVFDEMLQQIIDAEGIYIEDSSKKIVRSGVHGEKEALVKREALPIDPVALDGFNCMLTKMENGEGVRFGYDLTSDVAVDEEEETPTALQTVEVTDDEDDNGDEDENDGNKGKG